MLKKIQGLAFAAMAALALGAPAKAADVICYNCPPEWADWASMLKAIKADLDYDIPHDNKNSGQALAQIMAEKSNPVGDIGYFGVNFGMKAKAHDALEPYKPQLGPGAGRLEGSRRLLDHDPFRHARPVREQGCARRQAGAGLLEGSVEAGLQGHGRLSRSVVGRGRLCRRGRDQSGARRQRRTISTPAINFFKELRKNDPIVPKQTSYARVVSGEMPILLDYDFNAYRAKYSEKGNFEFVIPCEGSVVFPYVVGLVKNAPDKDKAKKVLDYLLSDKGQAIWTNAYLAPGAPDRIAGKRSRRSSCPTATMPAPRASIGARWKTCKKASSTAISPRSADAVWCSGSRRGTTRSCRRRFFVWLCLLPLAVVTARSSCCRWRGWW